MEKNTQYMVSIYMTTYYHEKYIKQAIESILSQKVNFLYEINISDDASKDETPRILEEYEKNYDFIHINLNETNIGLTANVFKARMMCSGKYIIQLSGDDYWIDDNKLQKHVDFLEKNNEYIGVVSRIEVRTESSTKPDFIVPAQYECNKCFTINDYLIGKNYPTNGLMMRNIIKEKYDLFSIMPKVSPYIDDATDCLLILTQGNVYISNDITVAYRRRISEKGEHNFNSLNNNITIFQKGISLLNGLEEELSGKYDLFHRYKRIVSRALFKCYRPFKKNQFNDIYSGIPKKYRKRALFFRSFFFMFSRGFELFQRKLETRG